MDENIRILTDEYLKLFYAFSISRTNNAHEAEELAQEIAYQCIIALNKQSNIDELNAFLWSIAHNSYKRWLYKRKQSKNRMESADTHIRYIENIVDMSPNSNIEASLAKSEDMRLLRRELALLTSFYRRVLVCFYYDELSIAEIAATLDLSVEMVKFYLQKGRNKLKEAYIMSKEYGEKSFNPAPFAVYRGTREFCSVNVWEIFSKKLPCQIALVCYDSPKKIDEICLETGVPAAYIEDELKVLVEAELLVCPVKDKFQTNFFILRKNALAQLKEQFATMYEKYTPAVISAYEKYLPEMKQCDIFKYDAEDKRYAWFFEDKVSNFDYSNLGISEEHYMTLADGVKGLIYAQEELPLANTKGHAGTYSEKDKITLHASAPGDYHYPRCERELIWDAELNKDFSKVSALYNIYKGETKDSEIEIYAQFIEQGYVFKNGDKLICDVAAHTEKSKKLFGKINDELANILDPLCKEIYDSISKVIVSTMPLQLKQYVHGYTSMIISFYAGIYFREALYNKGFIKIPEDTDKTPVSCWLEEHR